MIDSLSGKGLLTIQRGQQAAAVAADKVARSGTTAGTNANRDLTEGGVKMQQAEQLVKAGTRVLKTADAMIGSLLDDKA